jgi:hypothetical protein
MPSVSNRTVVPSVVKPIFDDNWLRNAQANCSSDSWANEVIETLDSTGQRYLSMLNSWFASFPLRSTKEKQHLRKRLESLQNEDHLGGVNELTWWAFMQLEGICGNPLTSRTSCPDFQLAPPVTNHGFGCKPDARRQNFSFAKSEDEGRPFSSARKPRSSRPQTFARCNPRRPF